MACLGNLLLEFGRRTFTCNTCTRGFVARGIFTVQPTHARTAEGGERNRRHEAHIIPCISVQESSPTTLHEANRRDGEKLTSTHRHSFTTSRVSKERGNHSHTVILSSSIDDHDDDNNVFGCCSSEPTDDFLATSVSLS